ncbi:MAG: sigma-E processing peptidase SpoIIGA, partial [Clostridia bacterium]|nr:sigma-E processing peptidase SpoIIGA [Clostridia bacterium]
MCRTYAKNQQPYATGYTVYLCYNNLIIHTKERDTVTVYADVSFFINFTFDAEILLLLCKVYSKKAPMLRLILASCLGGLLGVLAFIP